MCFLLWLAPKAWAHVSVSPKKAPAGSSRNLTFLVPHGCGEAPTVRVTIHIPKGVTEVQPLETEGWTTQTKNREGSSEVSEVIWSGGSLPSKGLGQFPIKAKLPNTPGETLLFPTLQECTEGSFLWDSLKKDDSHGPNSKLPGPTLLLLEKK